MGGPRAVANNARTPKDISTYTGLPNVQIPKYLSVLNEAGFVERRISVTAPANSRTGRHHITDPYLRFYFRFLASRERQLALDLPEQSLAEVSRHLIDFIGTAYLGRIEPRMDPARGRRTRAPLHAE